MLPARAYSAIQRHPLTLLLIGGEPKSNLPLCLHRSGTNYRVFLTVHTHATAAATKGQ